MRNIFRVERYPLGDIHEFPVFAYEDEAEITIGSSPVIIRLKEKSGLLVVRGVSRLLVPHIVIESLVSGDNEKESGDDAGQYQQHGTDAPDAVIYSERKPFDRLSDVEITENKDGVRFKGDGLNGTQHIAPFNNRFIGEDPIEFNVLFSPLAVPGSRIQFYPVFHEHI